MWFLTRVTPFSVSVITEKPSITVVATQAVGIPQSVSSQVTNQGLSQMLPQGVVPQQQGLPAQFAITTTQIASSSASICAAQSIIAQSQPPQAQTTQAQVRISQ